MEWIAAWLKKVILLVLLASFLDLVLPNTNMQRYVKMVMGLIILLAVMSPLLALFNLSPEQLALKINRYQMEVSEADQREWQSLSEQLLSHQETQMAEYVSNQLKAMIRRQVAEDYNLEVAQVEITMKRTEQNQESAIEEIIVTVAHEESDRQHMVKPIDPIHIALDDPSAGSAVPAVAANQPRLYREIANSIAEQWELTPDQVRVVAEQNGSSK